MYSVAERLTAYFAALPKGSRHAHASRLAQAIGVSTEVVRNWYRDVRVANKYHGPVLEWLATPKDPVQRRESDEMFTRARRVTPGPWSQYRPLFTTEDAWHAAMVKAEDYEKRGLPNRASRIRLNVDGMPLGEPRTRASRPWA